MTIPVWGAWLLFATLGILGVMLLAIVAWLIHFARNFWDP